MRPSRLLAAAPPSLLAGTGIVSLQAGAGLAGRLFDVASPAALTGLRLWSAAAVLAMLGWRGLRATLAFSRDRHDWAVVVCFGLVLAVMNFCIYQAFARIPLGIAVTIEFLGPLAVAVATSRRLTDLLWVALAMTGVLLLSHGGAGGGSLPGTGSGLNLAGVIFALVSAACWAGYIVLSAATGRRFTGSTGLVIAMIVAAIAVTGPAVAAGGAALRRPAVLATGVAVGLLSSVIPYRLELEALRRIPARVFGIWMSLEPAVAALAGLVLLGQVLALPEWLAIVAVVAASAGASATAGPRPVAQSGPAATAEARRSYDE